MGVRWRIAAETLAMVGACVLPACGTSHTFSAGGGSAEVGGDPPNDSTNMDSPGPASVLGGSGTGGANAGGQGGDGTSVGGACEPNACGSCAELAASPGESCEGCGTWTCDGKGSLACQSTCGDSTPVCKSGGGSCVACNDAADCNAATAVCHENACVFCEPSTMRCKGTTPWACNAAGSTETQQPIRPGVCGAACAPGALRCHSNIGEKCGTDGKAYISSGSNVACDCSDSARFSMLADGTVKDASTGLIWDFVGHANDTFAGASATCDSQGMRLPTRAELKGLLLTGSAATACSSKALLGIDSVAFPSLVADVYYWTNEPNFEGYLFTGAFRRPAMSGAPSTFDNLDRSATSSGPFRCVRAPE